MKYILLPLCALVTCASAMLTDRSQEIMKEVDLQIKKDVNQILLSMAVQSDPNKPDELKENLKNYYNNQPAPQTTVWAYLRRPGINTHKIAGYLQLLHASSVYVRQQAKERLSPAKLEMAPVDSETFKRAREEWPLMSMQFELEEADNKVEKIYNWAFGSMTGWDKNVEKATQDLMPLKKYREALHRAIEICKQSRLTQ